MWWLIKKISTQLLKFHVKVCTLVDEYFGWSPKPIEYPIHKCIATFFIIVIR